MTKARDYTNATKYENQPEQVKNRMARNRARAAVERKYGKAALKGKDVDHKVPLRSGGSTAASNTRLRSVHANRADNGR